MAWSMSSCHAPSPLMTLRGPPARFASIDKQHCHHLTHTKLGDRKVGSLSVERIRAVEAAILNYLAIEKG